MSNITITRKEDNFHALLKGTLDITTISEVKYKIGEVLNERPETVALNFDGVDFVDSSALAALVGLLKSSTNKKVELVLYGLNPDILSVFKIAGLDRFFTILTDEQFKKDYEKRVI